MQFQGYELKIRMKGKDVALLQPKLTRLSYQIPAEGRSKPSFFTARQMIRKQACFIW
jgi:hypothetical protein